MKSITRKICTALMALTFVSAPLYALPITSADTATGIVANAADGYIYHTDLKTKNVFKCKYVSYTEGNQSKKGICIEHVDIKNATVNVPSEVDSSPVVEIGDHFASGDTTITSLTLPPSLRKIGFCFCYKAKNLKKITFSGTELTALGAYAVNETKYRADQLAQNGYVALGNVLCAWDAEKMNHNGTKVDLGGSEFEKYTLIATPLLTAQQQKTVQSFRFPKNTIIRTPLPDLFGSFGALQGEFPSLKKIEYYNPTKKSWVEFKSITKSGNYDNDDKLAIEKIAGPLFYNYNMDNLKNKGRNATERYKTDVLVPAIEKFNQAHGIVYTSDAWKQYNIVREYVCYCRTIPFRYRSEGYAAELLLSRKDHTAAHEGMVCQGFEQMMEATFTYAGFDIRCIGAEGPHAYNIIKIGGAWFNVDSTTTHSVSRRKFMTTDTVIATDYAAPNNKDTNHTRNSGFTDPSQFPKCTTKMGDVDRNNVIDVADAQLILKAATNLAAHKPSGLNTKLQEVLCDVNCDGEIGADDAQIVLRYYTESTVSGKWKKNFEEYITQYYGGIYPQN